MNAKFQSEGSYVPDALIAGCADDMRGEVKTILSGQNIVRGTLLGRVDDGAVTATGAADVPAPVAATITASPTATTAAKVGIHRLVCIVAGATGTFRHTDPDGNVVGDATVGTAYTGGGLTFTITDAGTDPAVGEAFKITVAIAAGSGKYVKSLAAATNGSETPIAVAAEDVDASLGDVMGVVYYTGDFNSDAMTFGAGHTAASVKDALRLRGIHLHTPTSA